MKNILLLAFLLCSTLTVTADPYGGQFYKAIEKSSSEKNLINQENFQKVGIHGKAEFFLAQWDIVGTKTAQYAKDELGYTDEDIAVLENVVRRTHLLEGEKYSTAFFSDCTHVHVAKHSLYEVNNLDKKGFGRLTTGTPSIRVYKEKIIEPKGSSIKFIGLNNKIYMKNYKKDDQLYLKVNEEYPYSQEVDCKKSYKISDELKNKVEKWKYIKNNEHRLNKNCFLMGYANDSISHSDQKGKDIYGIRLVDKVHPDFRSAKSVSFCSFNPYYSRYPDQLFSQCDTLSGSSGGVLMCEIDNKWTHIGLNIRSKSNSSNKYKSSVVIDENRITINAFVIPDYLLSSSCGVKDKNINGAYKGSCSNKKLAHDYGKSTGKDTYEGSFKYGKKHGKGVYRWSIENRNCGLNLCNKRFEGEFLDGALFNGVMSYFDSKGQHIIVKGETKKSCDVTDPDIKGAYHGECNNTSAHGYGESTGKDTYKGYFEHGKKHGKGLYRWADGSTYDGTYKEGLRHGNGTMTWSDENQNCVIKLCIKQFAGEFKEEKLFNGVMTYFNSNIKHIFVDGEKQLSN